MCTANSLPSSDADPVTQQRDGWPHLTKPMQRCGCGTCSVSLEQLSNIVNETIHLSLLFTRLPLATTVEHFEALLPWNVKAELAVGSLRAR
jgi:hypothetical protein